MPGAQKEYVAGLSVKYVLEENPEKYETLDEYMEIFYKKGEKPDISVDDFLYPFPVACEVTDKGIFGLRNGIPAIFVKPIFDDPPYKSGIDLMWNKYNDERPLTANLKKPVWRIETKTNSPKRDMKSVVYFDRFFVKEVGAKDPLISLKISCKNE